jgi:hypothetical protein
VPVDLAAIDVYRKRTSTVPRLQLAWDKMDDGQRQTLEAACGLHDPSDKRPDTAVAGWLMSLGLGVGDIDHQHVARWRTRRARG